MGAKILRVLIWLVIVIAYLRGLLVFDAGPSADHHGTVGAGLCFASALLGTVLMFCLDVCRPGTRPE